MLVALHAWALRTCAGLSEALDQRVLAAWWGFQAGSQAGPAWRGQAAGAPPSASTAGRVESGNLSGL